MPLLRYLRPLWDLCRQQRSSYEIEKCHENEMRWNIFISKEVMWRERREKPSAQTRLPSSQHDRFNSSRAAHSVITTTSRPHKSSANTVLKSKDGRSSNATFSCDTTLIQQYTDVVLQIELWFVFSTVFLVYSCFAFERWQLHIALNLQKNFVTPFSFKCL